MENMRVALRMSCAFAATQLLFLVLLLLAAADALALDPAASLFDYRHDIWRRKDGAPANISSMAQTADGWLWIGTFDGLYRFDGLTFERFQPPSGRSLRAPKISTLSTVANGDLLVGYYEGGIDIVRGGDLLPTPGGAAAPRDTVFDVTSDIDGAIWLGTQYGILRYADGAWQKPADGFGVPAGMAEELTLDRQRQLWALVAGTWYKLDRRMDKFVATDRARGNTAFFAPDGQMWQRRGTLIERVAPGPAGTVPPLAGRQRHGYARINETFDADGNLWVLRAPVGIARIRRQDIPAQGSFDPSQLPAERLDQPWQLSGVSPTGVLEDLEGNIWVMSRTGIERFSHRTIRLVAPPTGVDLLNLAADASGTIWAGGYNMDGLWAVSAGAAPPAVVPGARRIAALGLDGAFVSNTPTGFERRVAGRTEHLPMPAECLGQGLIRVNRLLADRVSTWATMAPCGTFRYRDGAWHNVRGYGLPRGISSVTMDNAGALWAAHKDGDVLRYADGVLQTIGKADVGTGRFLDTQREVVISGSTGTAVLKGQRFERLQARDPAALKSVGGLMITPNGDRWLHAAAGIVHVRAADWQASVADPRIPLRTETFDTTDGYPGGIVPLPLPNGAVDASGKLWFAGTEGIGVLDPNKLYRNTLPPSVQITGVSGGGRQFVPGPAGLRLPESASTVQIRFAALSLAMPQRMQVLYRLEGVDRDWQSAGTMRRVTYANLAPGSYRFMVKAANANGVWNERGAAIAFYLEPRFVQTPWFYLLCFVALAALAYGLYLLRMRQVLARLNAVLGARLLERERIARALHDSLLQSVQGLVLRFGSVSNDLPPGSIRTRMEQLLHQADGVIVEARNAVQGLRAPAVQGGDIEQAFGDLGARLQREHGAAFLLRVRGAARPLDGAAWEEVFYVGHEALHNAYRHAGARQVTLQLEYGGAAFVLLVRDDGKGVPAQVLQQGASAGHWGLVGMRERAGMVDGTLALHSTAGRTTEVCLRIPAARAYAAGPAPGWLARLRAWLRG